VSPSHARSPPVAACERSAHASNQFANGVCRPHERGTNLRAKPRRGLPPLDIPSRYNPKCRRSSCSDKNAGPAHDYRRWVPAPPPSNRPSSKCTRPITGRERGSRECVQSSTVPASRKAQGSRAYLDARTAHAPWPGFDEIASRLRVSNDAPPPRGTQSACRPIRVIVRMRMLRSIGHGGRGTNNPVVARPRPLFEALQ